MKKKERRNKFSFAVETEVLSLSARFVLPAQLTLKSTPWPCFRSVSSLSFLLLRYHCPHVGETFRSGKVQLRRTAELVLQITGHRYAPPRDGARLTFVSPADFTVGRKQYVRSPRTYQSRVTFAGHESVLDDDDDGSFQIPTAL